jgi:phosphate transport system protein
MLERMGAIAVDLWRAAADGFADRDPAAGTALEAADDELDDLHTALTAELLAGTVPAAVAADATLVARFYERLGDHAVHIASRVSNAVA